MSRPRKTKRGKPYAFPVTTGSEKENEQYQKQFLARLRVDPQSEHQKPLGVIRVIPSDGKRPPIDVPYERGMKWHLHALVIAGIATEEQKRNAGDEYIAAIQNMSDEELTAFFSLVMEYRKNHLYGTRRYADAIQAAYDFENEFGFVPRRSKLKKFILSRPEKYRNQPEQNDAKGWLRIWDMIGIKE